MSPEIHYHTHRPPNSTIKSNRSSPQNAALGLHIETPLFYLNSDTSPAPHNTCSLFWTSALSLDSMAQDDTEKGLAATPRRWRSLLLFTYMRNWMSVGTEMMVSLNSGSTWTCMEPDNGDDFFQKPRCSNVICVWYALPLNVFAFSLLILHLFLSQNLPHPSIIIRISHVKLFISLTASSSILGIKSWGA